MHIEFQLHSTTTPYPWLYPSALQHEGCSHADHICVPVYVDVFRKYQVVLHGDSDSSLPF
jgi:hypothetical protein